jgi:phage terminase large subunit
MPEIKLHKFQQKAIFSEKRIIAAIGGLQSGKTMAGGMWMRWQTAKFKHPDDTFIVTSPTYKIMHSSTLPRFMKLHSEIGTLNRDRMEFKLNHGPIVYLRSMDNPWSAEGITNCRAIWGDEAGLNSTQAHINLMGRAAPRQANIFYSTTPYKLNNYLFRDLYEPWKKGELDDVEVVQWRSCDNPFFPKEEYERQKKLLDPRMFAMRYDGIFERMAGLVYNDFDYANYFDAFPIDVTKYTIFGGIDWGYTDPFAIVIRAIRNDGRADYQIGEYKCSGHTPDEQIDIVKQYQKVYGVTQWFADCADPGLIALFQKSGIPVTGVRDKNIEFGIGIHNAIIRSKTHKVFRGRCPETESEYEQYQYKDFDIDTQAAAVPLDINNHLMDANRYVTVETMWLRDRALLPLEPVGKTHLQRLLAGEFAVKDATADDW